MSQILSIIKSFRRRRLFLKYSYGFSIEESNICSSGNYPILTSQEKELIKQKLCNICDNPSIGDSGYRIFKGLYDFNPEYVPLSLFFPWMIRVLSPIDYARTYSNKSMIDVIFSHINQPRLVIKKIGGEYLHDGQILNNSQVIDLLSKQKDDILAKPSIDSCGGSGIKVIKSGTDKKTIQKILSHYPSDFIIQEKVQQSTYMSQFNESSLNTFRITTLLLNGKFTVCTAIMRCGNPGSFVDNVAAGGCCVGVKDNGDLYPFGFNSKAEKILSHNGIKFEEFKIPNYDKIIALCKQAHHTIPMCHYIGWDVALNSNDEAVLIEVNTIAPGVFFEQIATGRGAFDNRFGEAIEYIKAHKLPLSSLYNECM